MVPSQECEWASPTRVPTPTHYLWFPSFFFFFGSWPRNGQRSFSWTIMYKYLGRGLVAHRETWNVRAVICYDSQTLGPQSAGNIYINSIHIHIHIPLYMRLVLWSTGQVNSNSKTKSIVYVRALCLNVNYFTLIRFFMAFITRRWNGDGDDDDDDDARKQPKKRRVAAKSQSSTYCLKWRHSTNNCHRKNKSKAPLFLWPFNAILTRVCDKDLASKREK